MPRKICEIAVDIQRHWAKPSPFAVPYLNAMKSLGTISDLYGCDSARSILLYFLSNAATFRGEDARRLKGEIKELLR